MALDHAAASATIGAVTGFLIALGAFAALEALAWWRWKRPRPACGQEMMAGTGVRCRRRRDHRGQHLISPTDVFSAGYVLPPF